MNRPNRNGERGKKINCSWRLIQTTLEFLIVLMSQRLHILETIHQINQRTKSCSRIQ